MAERIIKVSNKTENFTISANEVPRRADLSARAKGIHSYLMTLPADWKLYKEELYQHFTEGRDAINTAFKELEEKGYIKKTRLKEKGRFAGWDYSVYETSTINGLSEHGKPGSGKPCTENPQLLSTDLILSTDEQNIPTPKEKREDERFLIFYQNYPRKVGKKKARTAFNKVMKEGETLDSILSKLKTYEKQIARDKTEEKYIKHPASFLNCLEDFDEEKPKAQEEKKILHCAKCGVELNNYICPSCFTNHDNEGNAI